MSSSCLKREVLNSFKRLHRTTQSVFKNDKKVLESARKEINENYKKNKNISDVESIKELIKFASEVHHELKTTVVELEETAPGVFRMHLRPDVFDETPSPAKKLSK